MGPITTGRWSAPPNDDARLDTWTKDTFGRFAVLERADEAVRIVVEREGVEVWPWVDLDATDLVLTGLTAVTTEPGRPPSAQLAGGLVVEERERQPDAVRIATTLYVLSTAVELEGWVTPEAVGRVFVADVPEPLENEDHDLDAEMRSRVPLLDAPGGRSIGTIEQGIAALSAERRGDPIDGLAPVAISIEDEDGERLARIQAFVPAAIVVAQDRTKGPMRGSWVAELSAPAAEPSPPRDIPAGSCLFDQPEGQLVGRTAIAFAAEETRGGYRALDADGLVLWAGPTPAGGCPSRMVAP